MTEKKEQIQDPAETARELIERSMNAGKAYTAAAGAATLAGLRTAFDLQNGLIAAGAQAVKTAQAETLKLVEANTKITTELIDTKV